jgi:hypothetical protein
MFYFFESVSSITDDLVSVVNRLRKVAEREEIKSKDFFADAELYKMRGRLAEGESRRAEELAKRLEEIAK